jgi:SAM-dependent methyltransferase
MPTKFVFAFAVENGDGDILLAKRSRSLSDYPCAWSLPTRCVGAEEFESGEAALKSASGILHDLLRLEGPAQVERVSEANRARTGYDIVMALFHVKVRGDVQLASDKYEAARWCLASGLPQEFPDGSGLSVAMLNLLLVEQKRIGIASKFYNVPPDLYGKRLQEWDNSRIWHQTAYDQYIEMRGKDGVVGGFFIKENTADRYVLRRSREILADGPGRVLDIGCGDGQFVSELRERGISAFGCDIGIEESVDRPWFRKVDLTLGERPWDEQFDLVIINLVLNWVQDMNVALKVTRDSCKDDGRIIVVVPAPEYSKNGYFSKTQGDFSWVIDEPTRSKPFPAMINLSVGPLIYYPRSFPDYINAFAQLDLMLVNCEYIFLDTELDQKELDMALSQWPDLRRKIKFPCFAAFEIVKAR